MGTRKIVGRGAISEIRFTTLPQPIEGYSEVAVKTQDYDEQVPPHNIGNELKILRLLQSKGGNKNVVPLISHDSVNTDLNLYFPRYFSTLYDVVGKNLKTRSTFSETGEITYSKINNMSVPRIKDIFIGVMKGLEFIHSCGIIHRDINPNNIMFTSIDFDPVIIDFGISWAEPDNYGAEKADEKYTSIGTGCWKAPELLLSVANYSTAIDIWSAAMILCMLASKDGRLPLDEEGSHSDLILLTSIFETFGTPTLETWPEASKSSAFQHMSPNMQQKDPIPASTLLFKLSSSLPSSENDRWYSMLSQMTIFESSKRPTASEVLHTLI